MSILFSALAQATLITVIAYGLNLSFGPNVWIWVAGVSFVVGLSNAYVNHKNIALCQKLKKQVADHEAFIKDLRGQGR